LKLITSLLYLKMIGLKHNASNEEIINILKERNSTLTII
jgi:hypothetical protein